MLLHGEAPPPGFVAHLLARQEFVERDRPVLGPDPAGRTEIRNAAFGRDAGAGERQDHLGAARPGRAGCAMPVSRSGAIIYGSPNAGRVRQRQTRSPCDISIPCCASAISTRALDFYCNKLGLKEVRRRVDEKDRYTLVFLAAPEDEGLRRRKQADRPRRAARRAHLQLGHARTMARRAISATSPTRSTTSTRSASG